MDSFIEIRSNRYIHVDIYPHSTSSQTIFLIHGLGGRSEQWREQIPFLKENHTVVSLDLLGHGKSAKPKTQITKTYSFLAFDQDLQALFNKYAGEKNIIIGHSYGGALATALTLEHQDRINKLILLSPLPCTPIETPFIYKMPTFFLKMIRPYLEKRFERLAFSTTTNPALLSYERKASKINCMGIIKAMVNGMSRIPNIDVTMITVPTLTIMGERDELIPISAQVNYYQHIPYQEFEMISNASHMVMLEQPQAVNELLAKNLD